MKYYLTISNLSKATEYVNGIAMVALDIEVRFCDARHGSLSFPGASQRWSSAHRSSGRSGWKADVRPVKFLSAAPSRAHKRPGNPCASASPRGRCACVEPRRGQSE
jgi:hypothetical protein